MKKTKRSLKPLLLLLILLVIILLAAGSVWFVKYKKQHATAPAKGTPPVGSIDLSPATPEDKQESNNRKEDSIKESTPKPGKTAVTPVIVDASQYDQRIEVRAYIPGVFEDGGTCTIAFSKDTAKFSKQVAASKDATTTRCTNLTVARSEFVSAGKWSVVVTYNSQGAEGSSQAATLEVR